MQRALLIELPGLGKPGALERRAYPPGQHGQGRKKFSDYGLRLKEKQKLVFHYCLREQQLRRLVKRAKTGPSSDWMNTLIGNLETRLDNIVFRLGFAPSISAARQLVLHGHILVNERVVTLSSQELKKGDQVSFTEKAAKNPQYQMSLQTPRLQLADYLSLEKKGENHVGTVKMMPGADHIPFPFDQGIVAEFYSKV